MNKDLTCIECPRSCVLKVCVESCRVVKVSGEKCPKGKDYAVSEVENPRRIFTSTVSSRGLVLKMIPVRTDKPIPKDRVLEAAGEIRKIKLEKPVKAGEIITENFLNLGVNLLATRNCPPLSSILA